MAQRFLIYAADDELVRIDAGAAAAGQSRSAFVVAAALERASRGLGATSLTKAQRRAVARAVAEFIREDLEA